jgi:hypothetical protein
MELLSVNSSQIAQVGHEGNKLQVLFRRGGLYEYSDVTKAEFDELINAESLGSHFAKHIKGVKPGVKIEGAEWPAKSEVMAASHSVLSTVVEPEDENQAVEKVARKSDLLVQNAHNIRVIDQTTQLQASDFLLGIKAIRGEIADTFKPMKDAAFRAHRVICDQEKKLDAPLAEAEVKVKAQIGAFVQEQQRIARAAEEALRKAELERAQAEAREEAQRLALEDALALEEIGDSRGAEAVLANPAPVPVRYVAPAPVDAQVAQVKGVGVTMVWDFRIVDEAVIPREYMLVNEAAIRNIGKATKGKAKVAGVEFFEVPQVSASRGR